MKARVQHLAPLSRHVLELLGKLRSITGDSEYLFPLIRDPKRPLHGTALSCGLRSLGFNRNEVTPHGFRATACTLLNELGWRPDAIARQLAHGTANDVRRHYSYAQHLPEHPGCRVLHQRCWKSTRSGYRTDGKSSHPVGIVRIDSQPCSWGWTLRQSKVGARSAAAAPLEARLGRNALDAIDDETQGAGGCVSRGAALRQTVVLVSGAEPYESCVVR